MKAVLLIAGLVIAWYLLQAFILPRFGVKT
jgi:hypothetical protein